MCFHIIGLFLWEKEKSPMMMSKKEKDDVRKEPNDNVGRIKESFDDVSTTRVHSCILKKKGFRV